MDGSDNPLTSVAHDIVAVLEHDGNVRAVFGAPMKLDTRTVIPVASVAMGGGAGGIRTLGSAIATARKWLWRKDVHVDPSHSVAGGGGGGIDVRPVGFLHEDDGRVVFTPIEPHHQKMSSR
jgi:uncharacterized spore protein YtfJ